MKLNCLGSVLLFLSSIRTNFVKGQGVSLNNYEEEQDGSIPLERRLPSIKLNITYNIEDKETPSDSIYPISFDQDEEIMLNYTLVNNENCNISVLGVSGSILTYPEGEVVTDITFGEMEDLHAHPNETINFRQKVLIDLEPGLYYLFPMVQVTNETAVSIVNEDPDIVEIEDIDTSPKNVAAEPTFLSIEEPLMSVFNPQFLSIQFIFLGIVGVLSYFYLKRTGKLNNNNNNSRRNNGKRDPKEWLPEQYKK